MTQRTCNIIALCKDISCRYTSASVRRNIASYMADANGKESADVYTDKQIDDFIENAFLDFLDGVNYPSHFVKKALSDPRSDPSRLSQISQIIDAFKFVQVKENKRYINGFTQELIDQMEIDLDPDISMR